MKASFFAVLAATFGLSAMSAQGATVYSNAFAPGDTFTNAVGTKGQAVGTSGWYYNNVRNGGSVGINDTLPQSGNGSVAFGSPSGSAKADVEYLAGGVNFGGNFAATGFLGAFADLTQMSYDWFRDVASNNPDTQHPALRVLLDRDGDLTTLTDRGGLVFERVYNGSTTAENTWTSDTVTGTTKLWNFGLGLGFGYDLDSNGYAYDSGLSDWQGFLTSAKILGFSAGVGSGWTGSFTGAVDNIGWTIAGASTLTNFEVSPVPLPAPLLMLATAFAGFGLMKRRKTRR